MFENMEQLEREIKEFEQNILASKDLITSIRDTADAVVIQNQTVETQIGKVVVQLKKVPSDIDKNNSALIKKLQESNEKAIGDFKRDLNVVLKNLNGTVSQIKEYEKNLEKTSNDSAEKTRQMIERSLAETANDFVKTVAGYQDGLSQAVKSFEKESTDYTEQMMQTVEELKKYEKILNTRYENLLTEIEQTNGKVIETVKQIDNRVDEIKKATEGKQNLITILLIICIIVSAVSIIL